MSIAQVISVINDPASELTTAGAEIARFSGLMKRWAEGSILLRGANDKQTKRNINRWLKQFEDLFTENMRRINEISGFGGWSIARDALNEPIEKSLFIDAFERTIQNINTRDFVQARLLRNTLARKWKKDWKQYYADWDLFQTTSNQLGVPFNTQVTQFTNSLNARGLTTLTDSAGKQWQARNYARMWSRTRGRETEDEVMRDEMEELGEDVIQINNVRTITPICLQFEGKVFSLNGNTPGLPILEIRPPFHPNCRHRMIPRTRMNTNTARVINSNVDKRFRKESAGFTPGQKSSIVKQEDWNRLNRK